MRPKARGLAQHGGPSGWLEESATLHGVIFKWWKVYATCPDGPHHLHRDWILGQKPDKSLKSLPPCYSQSHLQLCLEIFISSNACNPLQFLLFSFCTLQRRKEGNLIENQTPFIQKTSSLRTLKIMPRNLNEIVWSWIQPLVWGADLYQYY